MFDSWRLTAATLGHGTQRVTVHYLHPGRVSVSLFQCNECKFLVLLRFHQRLNRYFLNGFIALFHCWALQQQLACAMFVAQVCCLVLLVGQTTRKVSLTVARVSL